MKPPLSIPGPPWSVLLCTLTTLRSISNLRYNEPHFQWRLGSRASVKWHNIPTALLQPLGRSCHTGDSSLFPNTCLSSNFVLHVETDGCFWVKGQRRGQLSSEPNGRKKTHLVIHYNHSTQVVMLRGSQNVCPDGTETGSEYSGIIVSTETVTLGGPCSLSEQCKSLS